MTIKNLHYDPVLMTKLKDCRIQNGFDKIVHPINLTSIENNVLLISKLTRQLDNSLPIAQLATQKARILINNLRQIKPINSRRKRRWDTIGKAWKWLAGSPDAEDLRIINRTINELVDQNNKQLIINRMVNERIGDITQAVNSLIKQQNIENKIILEEYDTITLLLYMDTLNDVLEEIQDTILRTKIALPNNKILTLMEKQLIESLLQKQGIKTDFPEQALNYVTSKIAMKGDTLLYILQTPRMESSKAEIIQVLPLIVNTMVVIQAPHYLVKTEGVFFKTNHPTDFIQKSVEITPLNDNCLLPIMMGTDSKCNVTRRTDTQVTMISDNKLLINNGKNLTLYSNCGPHNRTLTGNFLITFNNCTLQIEDRKFTSLEVANNYTQEIDGAFANLRINRNLIEHQDILEIHNTAILNREEMKFISLKQNEHHVWILSILSGLSTTTIITIGIIIYICVKKRKLVLNVRLPKIKDIGKQPKGLQQMDNMAEDDHSSPPGGVTYGPATKAADVSTLTGIATITLPKKNADSSDTRRDFDHGNHHADRMQR